MNQFRVLAAVVTAAGLLAATPAAAVVKVATYSGIILSGYDDSGVFVAPGTDLTGYSWVATFTYDRTLGGNLQTDGATYDISFGGPNFGVAGSPVIAATFTIDGVTKSLAGQSGYIRTQSYPYVNHVATDASDDGITSVYNTIDIYAFPAGAPTSLDQNVGPVSISDGLSGSMQWYTYEYGPNITTTFVTASLGYDGVYSVSDAAPAAVPEPASWAMMVAGFGLVGAAVRRNKRVAAPRAIA